MGFILWIAWRAIVLFDLENPLLAVLFAVTFMIGGPFVLDALAQSLNGDLEALSWVVNTPYLFMALPLPFALIGAYLWSCIESSRI